MRRVLCVHMPDLASARVKRNGRLSLDESARPVVLTRQVGSSLMVEQACPRARQIGLRRGMTLAQAQAIAPDLLACPHEPQRDQALLSRLASWALRFSPIVQPVEPDTLLIDITGCQRLFGSESNIVHQAVGGLLRQGFDAHAAIADTIGAAYALASARGDPIIVVPEGQSSAYLARLPPAALRIEARISERLEALGVRTIGDLLMLPRASLAARFGPQVVLRLQQALGEVFEGVGTHEPERPPAARLGFDGVVCELQPLQSVAGRLLEQVFEQVLQGDLALRRIDCVLYYERVPPTVLSIGLSRASRSREHVGELLKQRLEGVDPTPGVCGLMLVARETSRWKGGQGELFEPRQPGDEEELGCLLDRLANRLGYDAVARPRLVDDHQPERAFRYTSETRSGRLDCAGKDSHRNGCEKGFSHQQEREPFKKDGGRCPPGAPRPVQLLPRVVPIRVIALLPDGPPTWFSYRGREHVLARAWGPERIETAWWRGPDVRRDYFRVVSESGEQFWIFCALPERRWYLHGVFT